MPARAQLVDQHYRAIARRCLWAGAIALALALAFAILATPAGAMDDMPVTYDFLVADVTPVEVTNFPAFPTPPACGNGHYVGSAPDCPAYAVLPTQVSQNGRVGVPVVDAGDLSGARGQLTLLVVINLFGLSAIFLVVFLDVLVIRRRSGGGGG